MERQPHLSSSSRAVVVNWLGDVNRACGYRPKTLFLAVALLDRFLEKRSVQTLQFQLVGVTAMMLAAKYEEVSPLDPEAFAGICDGACCADDIRNMEVSILVTLEFRLCQPVALDFAEIMFEDDSCTEAQRQLILYILELVLVTDVHLRYSPS